MSGVDPIGYLADTGVDGALRFHEGPIPEVVGWAHSTEPVYSKAAIDTLSAQLEAAEADAARAQSQREHTQQWYAERMAKIEEIAKREGLWDEVAAVFANGSATRRLPDGSYFYDPPTYAQQLNMAKHKAATAEARAEAAEAELSGIRRLVEIVGETESRAIGAAAMYLAARASECNAGEIKATMRGLTSAGKPIGDWDVTVQRSARTKEQQSGADTSTNETWIARAEAKLAQGEQQAVAWIRFCSDGLYEGPIHDSRMEDVRRHSGAWTPLYTRPQPVAGDAVREIVSDIRHSAKVDDYEAPQIAFLESVADRIAALSAAPAAPAPVASDAVLAEGIAQTVATELYGEPPEPGSNSLTRQMQLPRIRRAIEAAIAQDRAAQGDVIETSCTNCGTKVFAWPQHRNSSRCLGCVADAEDALQDEAAGVPFGCLVVEEASCVPHVHPSYGPGLFFTEGAVLRTGGGA